MFATPSQADAQLFAALARAVEQHVSDFNMQNIANTASAFAASGRSDVSLFKMLARVTEDFGNPKNTVWLA